MFGQLFITAMHVQSKHSHNDASNYTAQSEGLHTPLSDDLYRCKLITNNLIQEKSMFYADFIKMLNSLKALSAFDQDTCFYRQ